MRTGFRLALIATALASGPAAAAPPVLVELFTSQSCDSCPPADALLAELARDPQRVLALDLHVTYWDHLGWRDPYSLSAATDRQWVYAKQLGSDEVYTPQLVAGGRHSAVGSDRSAVEAAIAAAAADNAALPQVPLELQMAGNGKVTLSAGNGAGRGAVVLVGYDRQVVTPVKGGENAGRTLTEVDVVRSLATVGSWSGGPLSLQLERPAGERVAAFLQAEDGRILGLALLPESAGPA
jgi:hypothetical protein